MIDRDRDGVERFETVGENGIEPITEPEARRPLRDDGARHRRRVVGDGWVRVWMRRHGGLPIGGVYTVPSGIRIAPLRIPTFASRIRNRAKLRNLRGDDENGRHRGG